MRYDKEAKAISELGGPGSLIGRGYTQDDAIQMAIAFQLKRVADALSASPHPIARAGLDVGREEFDESVTLGGKLPQDVVDFISKATLLATNHGGWFDRDGFNAINPLCDKGNALLVKYSVPIPSHPRPDAEIDPYAHADGSRECRPATGKWSRPDAEARARELLAAQVDRDGNAKVAEHMRRGGTALIWSFSAIECLAKALAPAERGAIVEECARLVEQWNGATRDGDTFHIAAAIRQLGGEGNG